MAQCLCKINYNGKIASRQLAKQNQVHTNDLVNNLHWENNGEIISTLEMQPLNRSNRVFATLEDL